MSLSNIDHAYFDEKGKVKQRIKHIDKYLFYDERQLSQGHDPPVFVVVGDRTGTVPNQLGKEGFKVIVYEPDPTNYLTMVVELDLEYDVLARPFAITGKDEKAVLNQYDTPSSHSLFQREDRKKEGQAVVECVSMATVVKEFGAIDVMLINCEGGEWEILHEVIDKNLPVKQMCISFHEFAKPEWWKEWKPNVKANYKMIAGNTKYDYFLLIKK